MTTSQSPAPVGQVEGHAVDPAETVRPASSCFTRATSPNARCAAYRGSHRATVLLFFGGFQVQIRAQLTLKILFAASSATNA